jgi:predicted secreted protein
MAWYTDIIVYVIIWWLVLFMVLPVGVRTAHEAGQAMEPGQATSAPVKPQLLLKFLATTAIAATLFAAYWLMQRYNVFGVNDMFRS